MVLNVGDSIAFIDFLHAGGEKSLFTRFGPAPVSAKLATVSVAFAETLTDIQTRYVALRKDDATSYGLSSHCTLMTYCPSGGGDRSCSIADAPTLSAVLAFFFVGVTLFPCVVDSVDDSLRVTSDSTSSSVRCSGAKVTVC